MKAHPELLHLSSELSLVSPASKVSIETLKTTVTTIKDEHKKLTQELSKMGEHYGEVALAKLWQLQADTAEHSQKLEADLAGCTEALVAVTKFFGEERTTSPSNFLATLDRFL